MDLRSPAHKYACTHARTQMIKDEESTEDLPVVLQLDWPVTLILMRNHFKVSLDTLHVLGRRIERLRLVVVVVFALLVVGHKAACVGNERHGRHLLFRILLGRYRQWDRFIEVVGLAIVAASRVSEGLSDRSTAMSSQVGEEVFFFHLGIGHGVLPSADRF